MTTRLRFAATLLAAAALLLLPTVAYAYAPTGDDFIECVAGGDSNVECVAGVFEEGCEGAFTTSAGAAGTTTTANSDGEVEFDFDVDSSEDGEIDVTVECGTKVLSDTVVMVEDGEVIANAGFDSGTIVGIAAGAIALGAAVLVFSRRKGSTTA